MQLAYVILLILLIIYIPFYFYVRTGKLEKYGLVKYGPTVMLKTKLGTKLMDRLAKHRKVWRIFGFISKIITVVLMTFIVFIVVVDLLMLPQMIGSSTNIGLEYVLAIPGLNPMLPLVYGVIGLVVAMVIHELAHGIQSRANDIEVESSGLLYAVVPVGAFVEPNNEQLERSDRRTRMDMYSAGIATNTVAAIVFFSVMALCMTGLVSSEYGDNPAVTGVSSNSPAHVAGISATAILTGFETDGNIALNFDPSGSIDVYFITENGPHDPINIQMGVYVAAVTAGSPAANADMAGKFVRSITVNAERTSITNLDVFLDFMGSTKPGDVVTVELVDVGSTASYDKQVTLGTKGNIGFLGISTNYSGMMFTTPNTVLNDAINPFNGVESVSEIGNAAISYIASPFNGYSPIPQGVQWWYDSVDSWFWVMIQTMYWIFWLNLVLAVFNALPAVPFDGGYLFSGGVDWMAEKLKMEEERRERLVGRITLVVSNVMIFAFVLIVVVMII